VLVTALTKRLCEELTNFLHEKGIRVRYLHSDIETLERLEILGDLRDGAFDVLVGVNLLREGLDLPEVALVAILDADRQGFLRSEASLIQTMGRAARNADSKCILYAERITPEMQRAMDEVQRRRAKQLAHNAEHGIIPQTIVKENRRALEDQVAADRRANAPRKERALVPKDELVAALEEEMVVAARELEFERAARLRDELTRVRSLPEALVDRTEVDDDPRTMRSAKPGAPGTRPRRGKRRKPKTKE
jgi:excinuclease ABC subunit B